MATMQWVRADASDFRGFLPIARSGHTAVNIGKWKVIVFGGYADPEFLAEISVYDVFTAIWFTPNCTGSGSDGQVGPSPRAFHVAVAIDCRMYIFGGLSGSKRLGDLWMLDTDIWQWSELTCFGSLPSQRNFAAASAIGNRKIVMYGGWDGTTWLSDVYILDTKLSITGSGPPPRCGHTATMVEKRLLVFGGRGNGGHIMGDLWALKGLIEEEIETPGWTQLKLPGQSPSSRFVHSITSGGNNLLVFGGRDNVYHNDCIVLNRTSFQWKRLSINNEPPPARAYHSMTCIGGRYLLFGGFDGKTTFGDIWWLVPEDDFIARRSPPNPLNISSESYPVISNQPAQSVLQENLQEQAELLELQKMLGISISAQVNVVDEVNDRELLELSIKLAGVVLPTSDQAALHKSRKWCAPDWIQLRHLNLLLRDYQRLVINLHRGKIFLTNGSLRGHKGYSFFHMKNVSQLRMGDIPKLLEEYQRLIWRSCILI